MKSAYNFCINDSSGVNGYAPTDGLSPQIWMQLRWATGGSKAQACAVGRGKLNNQYQFWPAVAFLNERAPRKGQTLKGRVLQPYSFVFLIIVESGKTVRCVPFNVLKLESFRVSLNVAFGGSKQFTAINLVNERVMANCVSDSDSIVMAGRYRRFEGGHKSTCASNLVTDMSYVICPLTFLKGNQDE